MRRCQRLSVANPLKFFKINVRVQPLRKFFFSLIRLPLRKYSEGVAIFENQIFFLRESPRGKSPRGIPYEAVTGGCWITSRDIFRRVALQANKGAIFAIPLYNLKFTSKDQL